MPKFSKVVLLFSLSLCLLEGNAFADARWKRCIRMSFPGKAEGLMTNLCSKNLYAIWYDDKGEHSTAIGANQGLGLGRIHGRFQVHDAYPQFGFGDNSNRIDKHVSGLMRGKSSAERQQCEERKAHNYRSASIVESSDPDLAATFRSSADSAYSACLRGGNFSAAYGAALDGRSSRLVRGASTRANARSSGRCAAGETLFLCDAGTPEESKRCLSNPDPVDCHRM